MKQRKWTLFFLLWMLSACAPAQVQATLPATITATSSSGSSLANSRWRLESFGTPEGETRILSKWVPVFLLSGILGLKMMVGTSSGTIEEQVDAFVNQQMARNHLPGLALAITQGEQVVYLKGYGKAADQAPITPQTQFYLASVSKSFTAIAVMQLVEAGKIDLDASIQQYLPDFAIQDGEAAGRITVRHLLNHTSGLSDQGFPELRLPQMKTPAERLRSLRSARPVAPPGVEFHYFNPNYEVLARLVEVVSGKPFSAYLQKHIFSPLEMENTFNVLQSSETEGKASRLAQGHILPYGVPLPINEMTGYVGGSGGVISTAEDLAKFLIMQNQEGRLGKQVLVSAESMATMHRPPAGIQSNYGMGWMVRQEQGRKILEHNGIFSAFYAEVVLLPEEKIGIALLYNASSLPATAFAYPQIKNGLIDLLTGSRPPGGGFSVTHWGILLSLLTLIGIGLAWRSLFRLPQWKHKAEGVSTWRLVPGVLWAFAPALFLFELPSLVAAGAGRVFGYAALLRSMPELFVWLGTCAVLGVINGIARLGWIGGKKFERNRHVRK